MTKPKPFRCSSCEKGFASQSARAMHMNDVHGGPDLMIEQGRKAMQKPPKSWLKRVWAKFFRSGSK